MSKQKLPVIAVAAGLLLLMSVQSSAQVSSGSISGNVHDPSQATVAGATVTLVDAKNGSTRAATTDDQGGFAFPQVSPGTYNLIITSSSFAEFRENGIELHVNQSYKIDAALRLSADVTKVEVTANDLNINTESSEVSSLLTPKQITEIPLNGRNFLQLLTLVPGSSPGNNLNTFQTGLLSVTRFSLSGTADDAGVYTVDGAQMRDPGGNNVIPVFPSIDSIQEFRVQTNSYGPQFGGGGGAQVNIITKSGGNQFHGTAYEFVRNDKLDANSYLLNQARKPRGKLRYNDFGYTIGGPVKTGKLYFFFSQEFRRQGIGVTRAALVPTALEKQGDFSQDATNYNTLGCYTANPSPGAVTTEGGCATFPIDPNTSNPLGWVGAGQPLNASAAKIPANEFDSAGQAFLQLYPGPNTTDVFSNPNWIDSVTVPIKTRQETVRGDYKISDKASLLVRYTHDSWANGSGAYSEQLWGEDGFPTVQTTWNSPGQTLVARLTHNAWGGINTVGYSLSKTYTSISGATGWNTINAAAVAAIPAFFTHPGGQPHAIFWGAGGYPALWHNAPFYNDAEVHSFSDDYAKVIGRHTLIAGAVYNRGSKNDLYGGCACSDVPQLGGATGFVKNGTPTAAISGNTIADLLFENMTFFTAETNSLPHVGARYNNFELYAGDTFRITPSVTLNYGVRWSLLRMPYAANDNIANFYPNAWTATNAASPLDGLITPSGSYGRSLIRNQNHLFAPRVGFSWDPLKNGRLVVRSGFGQFFATVQSSGQFLQLGGNPPYVKTLIGKRYLDTAAGFDFANNPLTAAAAAPGAPGNGIDPNLKNPNTLQWNLTVAGQLTPNNVVQIAYVGNRGEHNYIKEDINQVLPSNRLACAQNRIQFLGCAAYRPYGAGVIGDSGITYLSWGGDSVYHGLQASYQGRFGPNTQVHLNYTWSKLNGDTGLTDFGASPTITDTFHPGYDRGLLSYDRAHVFTANYIYALPRLQGSNAFLHNVLGGWEVSGITTIDSGLPLTVTAGAPADYTGIGNPRPDLVPGLSANGRKTKQEWFNTSAFTLTDHPLGALGTAGRGIIRGPGIGNQDISIGKNWSVPWIKSSYTGSEASIQFRAEFFNAFNHTQPVNVDTNFIAGNVVYDGPPASATKIVSYSQINSNFGHVTSYRDPRQIQFGLKLNW
jgi:hypothetical protein